MRIGLYFVEKGITNIFNLSEAENLVTVMWTNGIFDPNHPDTFGAPV